MTRREERTLALNYLFEYSFRGDESPEDIIQLAAEVGDVKNSSYATGVFLGAVQRQPEIDELIEKNLIGWTINRISRVSMSILRLAVYEMLYMDKVPPKVSINEAVELAKAYATEEDAAYINGVLGTLHRAFLQEKK